jgi:4-amino-4-deoxy-L-arabinose transferase-like glycosyltransferase
VSSSPSRREWAAFLAVVAFAAVLRFLYLGSGVPAAVASDEPFLMERVFAMMTTGDFNPHVYDYPTLYVYMQTALASVRFLVGTLRGEWFSLAEVTATDFYLWGRALTALLGTLTVVVAWRIGRRLGPAAGLWAAAFLAVNPQHVRESHFALTDVPMTFFVTLTLLLSVRAAEVPALRSFAAAGAAAGLAAATKYTAGVSLVMPLVALVWARWNLADRLRAVPSIIVAAAFAFLLGAPYSLLDLPAFLNGFGFLASAHAGGTPPAVSPWWTYLLHLNIILGTPLVVMSVVGVAVGLVQMFRAEPPMRAVWAAAVIFVVIFYAELSGQTLVYGRYLLPLMPALLVVAGGAVSMLLTWSGRAIDRTRHKGMFVAALGVILLAVPLQQTAGLLSRMSKTSSNELAFAWMLEEIPDGARVAVEAEGMKLPPRFRARNVARLIDHSVEEYVGEGVEYLVASSLASRNAMAGGPTREGRAYTELFRNAQLLFAVTPTADHPGSEIRVYRLVRPVP